MEYEEIITTRNLSFFNSPRRFKDFGKGAFILKNEDQLLYIVNGEIHRDDGPAQIIFQGPGYDIYFTYYKHDLVHCETGPADIHYNTGLYLNGPIEEKYYLYGKRYLKKEWEKQLTTKLYW